MKPKEGWDISLDKKINVVLFVVGLAAFFVLASLYNVEPEFVFYVVSVCGILGITGWAISYTNTCKKHKVLRDQIESCHNMKPEEWKEALRLLEKSDDVVENDYKELLEMMQSTCEEQNHIFFKEYQAKQDFFTMWAHQIKTPIAALQLLLQSEEPVNTGECRQELFKIDNYVGMALNYLRFDNIRGDLDFERCSLESMVKQVAKKYATSFIYRHIGLELKNLDIEVLTDEKWFVFALEQIVSNAIKYTKQGTVCVEGLTTKQYVELKISDTGMGIRQEDLPRIFEKGFTGYNGRIDKKASGLGLYLCKGILDKLGHGISIESKEGEGTMVTVRFERKEELERNLTKM